MKTTQTFQKKSNFFEKRIENGCPRDEEDSSSDEPRGHIVDLETNAKEKLNI